MKSHLLGIVYTRYDNTEVQVILRCTNGVKKQGRMGSSEAEPLCFLQFLRGTVKLTHDLLFLQRFGRNGHSVLAAPD